MSDLLLQFEQATQDALRLPKLPETSTMLTLYGLYKQAYRGDVDSKRPDFTDMIGRAKWDAWSDFRGVTADEAKRRYVKLVEELKARAILLTLAGGVSGATSSPAQN